MRGERRDPTSDLEVVPDAGRVRRCAAKWIRVFLVGRASVALKGFFRRLNGVETATLAEREPDGVNADSWGYDAGCAERSDG